MRILAVAILVTLLLVGCKGGSNEASSSSLDRPAGPAFVGEVPAFPFVSHIDQRDIAAGLILFVELFDLGDELFETRYNAFDGVGLLVLPDGTPFPQRFSRVPPGGGRVPGPNAESCSVCHNFPFPTSAGGVESNVFQDPARTGMPPFNIRNSTSLFGLGLIQRLAEEITEGLRAIRARAASSALPGDVAVTLPLVVKGIDFGSITAMRDASGVVTFDTSSVEGIDVDLCVRPFGWKGNLTTLRGFIRGAACNEMGMQPAEIVAKDPSGIADLDGDGVEEELSIGDITALTIYVAAQEVPTTLGNLVSEGFAPPPTLEIGRSIIRGSEVFDSVGCAVCHVPELHLVDPVFEEPTRRGDGAYLDPDIDPVATGLDPDRPSRFHFVRQGDPPRPVPHPAGGVVVRIYGDLKRHQMGEQLADAQVTMVSDASGKNLTIAGVEVEVAESVFLTAELWGAGNTGPWLHDGRAGTLEEAILLHGVDAPPPVGDPSRSEAQEARDAFVALGSADRAAVVNFLGSLVLFSMEEEE